jgi:hypothetical protein
MTTNRFDHELSAPLAQIVRSTDSPAELAERAAETAQQRLLERLAQVPTRTRFLWPRVPTQLKRGWLIGAATSVMAVMVMLLGPLLSSRGDAFAAMQERLRYFNTMVMQVTHSNQARVVQRSTVTANAQGVVRTDIGRELSIVVDPIHGRVLTLLHQPKRALVSRIPAGGVATREADAMSWLDEIRNFQGKAKPIERSHTIGGRTLHGWTFTTRGLAVELWADDQSWPVEMRMLGAGALQLDYTFQFDQAISPTALSSELPAGYSMVSAQTNE